MKPFSPERPQAPTATTLPAVVLSRYLFFLTQRPISRSNTHYLRQRIRGLQALGPLLPTDADEALATGARLLSALEPDNLREVAERLQQLLYPFAVAEAPDTYIGSEASPPCRFVGSSDRILLVLGPAIGIGDEIVTFPLPAWIKRGSPSAQLTVLTAYDGLWERVTGVDRIEVYRDYATLVRAMRGQLATGEHDLVLFLDFENPDLYRAVSAEGQIARYAEISLGQRVLAAVDNRDRWTYHHMLPASYFRNVYDGFAKLVDHLGVPSDRSDWLAAENGRVSGAGELRVFVSPFSSKYDPSTRYWSALLSTIVPDEPGRAVRFVLDVGPNAATRRFALDVARAAAARTTSPRVAHDIASVDLPGRLSLRGVLHELDRAEVVVCADSFAAHAAPRHGCTTLVLASPGLENWRVPSDRSYYFPADAALEEVVAGMRRILALHGVRDGTSGRPRVGAPEQQLIDADGELERLVTDGAPAAEVFSAFQRFTTAKAEVADRVAAWPPGAAALVQDHDYGAPTRTLNGDHEASVHFEQDALRFVEHHWSTWRNTNLRKYLSERLRADVP